MSEKSCSACNDLREYAPEFVVNGVTDNVCENLGENRGLSAADGHTDCDDLHDVNDCLIANMDDELDAWEVCDWKDFMHQYIPNDYETNKAMICAICGLWNAVTISSYVGVLSLHRTSQGQWDLDPTYSDGETGYHTVVPPFQTSSLTGTLPSGVITTASDYKSVTINNTTGVPLLVDAVFNSSVRTNQHFQTSFITITKDGTSVGQTPFISPSSNDQQVRCEPFILAAGASTTLSWYFGVGHANNWFISEFRTYGGDDPYIRCCLEPNDAANPGNQQSYFVVTVTGIPQGFNRA